MSIKVTIVALFLAATATGLLAANGDTRTEYEQFAGTVGKLFVTEQFSLPTPDIGLALFGSLQADLFHTREVVSQETMIAMRIIRRQRPPRWPVSDEPGPIVGTVLVDEHELDSLLQAVHYLQEHRVVLQKEARTLTRMVYTTKNGFRVGLEADPSRTSEFAVCFIQFPMADEMIPVVIDELLKMIDQAVAKIDLLRPEVVTE